DDTADIVAALESRFPNLTAPSSESICYATTNRQEAVKMAAPGTDMFLIVGAPNSSNSRRLVEVARRHGAADAVLVQRAGEIDWSRIEGVATVGISAGASAPEIVVQEIVDAFRDRFDVTVDIALTVEETENFPVMRDLRDTELSPADMAFLNGTNN
ncbi:MAG: 4-hydroxy-3-methylbut-2-enyl diphosphate reductase, partial [Oricola sp.]